MLYKKNNTKKLDMELFKNPTSEYRGTPFWAWNCKLDKETLTEQIEYLKQMGFGGFHMHSRSGMATEYLSEEFFDLVKTCVEKAKAEDMLAWLYDEDRWPSGAAGGIVTKNRKYARHHIEIMQEKYEDSENNPDVDFFAAYDIEFNQKGEIVKCKCINEDEKAENVKLYAYIICDGTSGWHNGQAYVDTLSKEAISEFIRITHEAYKKNVGSEFGETVPAIFTDEPNVTNFTRCNHACLKDNGKNSRISIGWTVGLEKIYEEKYHINIKEHLPEIFWELEKGQVSQARYYFHDCIAELFASAFMDNCAKWCEANGIHQTGHVLAEQSLCGQTEAVGEAMRTYRSMGIPGIDMLCNAVELTTIKQAQSVAHQYGREGVMSELYGVTNWDFDFRGHKFQGDWQAAFGVSVRVPHLSWVSMKGSAKRDYPASINYQSPWFKEYSYVEDHFARLNTVLTRGKPVANVGVIHPIESCWINNGPADVKGEKLRELEDNFQNVTKWLSYGLIDFDFISESMLPELTKGTENVFKVGEMNYSAVVIPGCDTIRRTTFELLKKFSKSGGRIIFCGGCPRYIDAVRTDEVYELYKVSEKAEMSKVSLLTALEPERFAEIRNSDGNVSDSFIHSVRKDNDIVWFFAAHAKKQKDYDVPCKEDLNIILNGEFIPSFYDTVNANVSIPEYHYENGKTIVNISIYDSDSILLGLKEGIKNPEIQKQKKEENIIGHIDFKNAVKYSREEMNVYMLDLAEYKLDDEEFNPLEEVLRIDVKCREKLGFPMADGQDIQPWVISEEKITHYVTLRYNIESETDIKDIWLGVEEAESIELNGNAENLIQDGYFVDKSIKKFKLSGIKKGQNILTIKVPFGKRTSIECCYLLGNFNVSVAGLKQKLLPAENEIYFGNTVSQGLPFYGGNITYKTEIDVPEECSLEIFAGKYRGALIKVAIDGKDVGKIVYSPYALKTENIAKGRHTIEFTVFGTRVNTFGSLHNYNQRGKYEFDNIWYGPDYWYQKDGEGWSYEYILKETGMLSSPRIIMFK